MQLSGESDPIQLKLSHDVRIAYLLALAGFLTFVLAIPAVLKATKVLRQTRHKPEFGSVRRRATISMALGFLVLFGLPLGVLGYGAHILISSHRAANELAAINQLRLVAEALRAHHNKYGGFPTLLDDLGPFEINAKGSEWTTAGYVFNYIGLDERGLARDKRKVFERFRILARPKRGRIDGIRYFYMDESGVIRISEGTPATAGSDPIF